MKILGITAIVVAAVVAVVYRIYWNVQARKARLHAQNETLRAVHARLVSDNEMLLVMKSLIREAELHSTDTNQPSKKKQPR